MWLRDAHDDLRIAEHLINQADLPVRDVCWHSHQAAEKALKAALTLDGTMRVRTHVLTRLWGRLEGGEWPGDPPLDAFSELGPWALRGRYIDSGRPPSREDAERTLEQARAVLGYVEAGFRERGVAIA